MKQKSENVTGPASTAIFGAEGGIQAALKRSTAFKADAIRESLLTSMYKRAYPAIVSIKKVHTRGRLGSYSVTEFAACKVQSVSRREYIERDLHTTTRENCSPF